MAAQVKPITDGTVSEGIARVLKKLFGLNKTGRNEGSAIERCAVAMHAANALDRAIKGRGGVDLSEIDPVSSEFLAEYFLNGNQVENVTRQELETAREELVFELSGTTPSTEHFYLKNSAYAGRELKYDFRGKVFGLMDELDALFEANGIKPIWNKVEFLDWLVWGDLDDGEHWRDGQRDALRTVLANMVAFGAFAPMRHAMAVATNYKKIEVP